MRKRKEEAQTRVRTIKQLVNLRIACVVCLDSLFQLTHSLTRSLFPEVVVKSSNLIVSYRVTPCFYQSERGLESRGFKKNDDNNKDMIEEREREREKCV